MIDIILNVPNPVKLYFLFLRQYICFNVDEIFAEG